LIFGAYDIIVDNFDDFITSISDLFQKAKQRRRKMGASHDAADDSDGDADEEEFFDNSVENIDDYLDDFEKLNCFTKEQLKNYCREHGIAGYSGLNKEALIHLIMDYQTDKAKEEKTARQNKVNSEKNNNGINKIYFSDIAGLEEAKDAFREKVILPFEHKELFEKYGKKAGGGILLYGLPGTGKTMFAEACSNELNALFIPIKCSDIKSKWYGESEENVKKIFEKARKAKRSIIFFDEFEAIGAKRTDNDDNGNNDLVPQILAEMQGIGSSNNESTIMVIAATNKPWAIDSAFLRPGRFDEKIYIPLPDIHARKKLFELKLKNVPAENLDFEYLASMTDGFNGADITEFCEKLKISAIKATISSGNEHLITMDDVYNVKDKIKSSVSQDDIADMQDFEKMS
jgi:transitional endoplasmic reticulum ATPase